MMKFSVCVDAVYQGYPFEDSVRSVKRLGMDTIEFWTWWDKDLDLVKRVVEETEMKIACFCTKFISLVDPAMRDFYLSGLAESINVAKRLNCSKLITQVGNERIGGSRASQQQSLIDGLKAAAKLLEAENITLLVEPLNTAVDHQGYFLASSSEAFDAVSAAGSDRVKVLYDIYHQQVTEGHIISTIQENIELIGHFHAAGNPGRHELDNGELNFEAIFAAIRETGFEGGVGFEYFPTLDPEAGLRRWVG
ncbi:hydroxypyruvate isomerase family protein [Cohnella sp. 56]|uniref:hydroxypyruvate isomerase family protein n=1 Tax=Cohnella sp. 56 TaxID=3113722 RepID=UPI0030E7A3D3